MLSWSFFILMRLSIVLGILAVLFAGFLAGKAGKAMRAWARRRLGRRLVDVSRHEAHARALHT